MARLANCLLNVGTLWQFVCRKKHYLTEDFDLAFFLLVNSNSTQILTLNYLEWDLNSRAFLIGLKSLSLKIGGCLRVISLGKFWRDFLGLP